MLVYVFGLWCAITFVGAANKCENGVDNVLELQDVSGESGWVRFHDVKVATFDANLQPFCAGGEPALHLPGFLQLISGIVEVRRPIKDIHLSGVSLDLSASQNSFFVGEVCRRGKSQNVFVADDVCSWDICALLGPESCKFLEKSGRIRISDAYPQPIPLEPAAVNQMEGEWSLSATLRHRGNELARVALPQKWHQVVLGDDRDAAHFRRNVERLNAAAEVEKPTKIDDEL